MALNEKEMEVWEQTYGMPHPRREERDEEVSDNQGAPDLRFEGGEDAEFFGLPAEGGFEEDEEQDEENVIPEAHRNKTRAQLAAELEAKQKEADLGVQLRDGIAGLRESFQRDGGTPAPAPPAPAPSEGQHTPTLEELGITNDTIFDNSVDKISKLTEYKMQPYLRELAERDLRKDRRLLQIDPSTGDYARRHLKEIDAIVNSMPAPERYAGNAYDVAYQRHQAQNQDEVMADRLTKRLNEDPESLVSMLEKAGYTVSRNGAPSSTAHSEPGTGGPASAPGGNRVKRYRVSEAEARRASVAGVDIKQFVSTTKNIPLEQVSISNEREVREWQRRRSNELSR